MLEFNRLVYTRGLKGAEVVFDFLVYKNFVYDQFWFIKTYVELTYLLHCIMSDREKRSKERIDHKKLNDGLGVVDEVKVAPSLLKGCQDGLEDLAVFSEEGERSFDSYEDEVDCKESANVKFDKELMKGVETRQKVKDVRRKKTGVRRDVGDEERGASSDGRSSDVDRTLLSLRRELEQYEEVERRLLQPRDEIKELREAIDRKKQNVSMLKGESSSSRMSSQLMDKTDKSLVKNITLNDLRQNSKLKQKAKKVLVKSGLDIFKS